MYAVRSLMYWMHSLPYPGFGDGNGDAVGSGDGDGVGSPQWWKLHAAHSWNTTLIGVAVGSEVGLHVSCRATSGGTDAMHGQSWPRGTLPPLLIASLRNVWQPPSMLPMAVLMRVSWAASHWAVGSGDGDAVGSGVSDGGVDGGVEPDGESDGG